MAQPRKILCIEDDRETADFIVEGLRDRGFEVSVAYRGPDGRMSIMRATPDPVLCDVGMPNITGLEVLQTLNGIAPQFGRIPFVFLTALADRENELRNSAPTTMGASPSTSTAWASSSKRAGVPRTELLPKFRQAQGSGDRSFHLGGAQQDLGRHCAHAPPLQTDCRFSS